MKKLLTLFTLILLGGPLIAVPQAYGTRAEAKAEKIKEEKLQEALSKNLAAPAEIIQQLKVFRALPQEVKGHLFALSAQKTVTSSPPAQVPSGRKNTRTAVINHIATRYQADLARFEKEQISVNSSAPSLKHDIDLIISGSPVKDLKQETQVYIMKKALAKSLTPDAYLEEMRQTVKSEQAKGFSIASDDPFIAQLGSVKMSKEEYETERGYIVAGVSFSKLDSRMQTLIKNYLNQVEQKHLGAVQYSEIKHPFTPEEYTAFLACEWEARKYLLF